MRGTRQGKKYRRRQFTLADYPAYNDVVVRQPEISRKSHSSSGVVDEWATIHQVNKQ